MKKKGDHPIGKSLIISILGSFESPRLVWPLIHNCVARLHYLQHASSKERTMRASAVTFPACAFVLLRTLLSPTQLQFIPAILFNQKKPRKTCLTEHNSTSLIDLLGWLEMSHSEYERWVESFSRLSIFKVHYWSQKQACLPPAFPMKMPLD